jgi:hypothetical protein
MKEFWSELVTKPNWIKLNELNREFDFILIGGWEAYLWTKAHKSKDIDIVVNYNVLDKLSKKYELVKNERLRNYEIRMKEYDIDVHLPYFSNLGLPVEKYKALLDHYKVPQLLNELRTQIALFGERDLAYIDLNIQEFSRWKKKFLGVL